MPRWLEKSRPFLKIPGVTDRTVGATPGFKFIRRDDVSLKKAPADGVYTLGKGRFRVRKGAPLPDGAVFTKVANDKPRGRSAAKGPSETTEGAGPSEVMTNAEAEKAKAEKKAADEKAEAEKLAEAKKAEDEAKARSDA